MDPAPLPRPPAPDAESIAERYRMLFESSHEGIYVADRRGWFVDANPALLDLLGYSYGEILGIQVERCFANPDDRARLHREISASDQVRAMEVRLRKKDGRDVVCLLSAITMRDPAGEIVGYQGILNDITDRKRAEDRLRHQALHDGLTQLPNRSRFLDKLNRMLERLRYEAEDRFGVLFVDLDRFKLVNDSMGHRAGDELLVLFAERLLTLVRPEDIVARLGGDEFAVLLIDIASQEEAEGVAERIRDGLREPFSLFGHEVYVSASMGLASVMDGYETAEDVIRDADTAMYAAKEKGGGQWLVFDEDMHARAVTRFATETALRRALEREEFSLLFQPVIELETGDVFGFEALLRWEHPDRGLLAPDEFLAIAEETGLIVPIGTWTLHEAAKAIATWRERSGREPALVMSVNISGRQLMVPGFGAQMAAVLDEFDLPGRALSLEVTEAVFVRDSESLRQTLRELEELGIGLCLDDFGTGYSTLSYLQELPVNVIKIDRSFVEGLSTGGGSEMVETILSLANQLGIDSVAEGVETDAERGDLLRLGCAHAQGFLFSHPLDAEQALALVEASERSRRS